MGKVGLSGTFFLEIPTRVLFGPGVIKELPQEMVRIAGEHANVLLITDKNIKKTGLIDKVTGILDTGKCNYEAFLREAAEPTYASMREIAKRGKDFDLIVGLGGGSCMDTAKAVAMLATNTGDASDYVYPEAKEIVNDPRPTILIPTTAGTGSEVTHESVIIEEKKGYRTKHFIKDRKIFSDVAIVDPELMTGLPPKITAATGMDALTHVSECLMSVNSHPMTELLELEAIQLISKYLRRAYYSGMDMEARCGVSLAALLGGCIITFPGGTWLVHCIAEHIGPRYNIPHGIACSIVLPHVMEFNLPACISKLSRFASAMDGNYNNVSARESAIKAVNSVFSLAQDIELPTTLKEVNVPKTDLAELVAFIVDDSQFTYGVPGNNPKKLTHDNMSAMFERMWEGHRLYENA
ncbi:MAG: iron-containing alcohol dehydrogenase [Dehalococcoidia bacterium]|nr:iron-containing alcohol dehydrogenase [Dehalococcoidia bacterium]